MREWNDWSIDFSEGTRAAWEAGFAKTIELDTRHVPAVLGAAAYSLWRSFPGVIYLTGGPGVGKTTIARQALELLDLEDPSNAVASFVGSSVTGLMKSGALLIDDVPAGGGAAQRKNEERVAELARIVRNQAAVYGDHGLLYTTPPILLMTGELLVGGSTADRMLVLEIAPVESSDVAESAKSLALEARRVFAERFRGWLAHQDPSALADEFEDYWPGFDSEQVAAAAFGVELLNRYLADQGGQPIELHPQFARVREETTRPPLLEELAERVIGAIWLNGTHRLVGADGDSSAPVLGRVSDDRVALVPAMAVALLGPSSCTTAGLAAALDSHGVLRRDVNASARTITVRLEGKATRVWETEDLFNAEELALLRKGHEPMELM